MLSVLHTQQDSRKAYETLENRLKAHAEIRQSHIGWQGGGTGWKEKGMPEKVPVLWFPKHQLWCYCSDTFATKRFWIVFGTQEPTGKLSLTITCEINVEFSGFNRRVAGAFVTDGMHTYLAHSGRLGGGRKGIGKKSVLNHLKGQDQLHDVLWPDNEISNVIVVGALDSPDFIGQLATFVHQMGNIKDEIAGKNAQQLLVDELHEFSPEFQGKRKAYTHSESIESNCNHGLVINALSELLKAKNIQVANDKARDLYVIDKKKKVRAVFEAKTDTDTSSIYKGIGQLMFATCLESPDTRRIFVLPDLPTEETANRLRKLNIEVLEYAIKDGEVTFRESEKIIGKIHS